MKQAILVVAFGSTVDSAREHQIDAVVNRIKEKYTDYEVRLAFSSRIIVKRLRDRGIEIPTEQGALDALIDDGYTDIYVQPLHFTGGEEYPNDYQILIDTFVKSLAISNEDGLLFVGHGGLGSGNSAYGYLQYQLIRSGLNHIRVATLENAPYVADIAVPWEWLDGKKPNKIYVHPLLLVLGDHALNDLFGDEEDSVVNVLKEAGYEVEEMHHALGEYTDIQDIYCQHIQDCIDDIYGKRSSHRPTIPNIK